jgi:hypothetical protein
MKKEKKSFSALLGCSNQEKTKVFLSAKDIKPRVDEAFLKELTIRCSLVFQRLNTAVHQSICHGDIDEFIEKNISNTAFKLSTAGLLDKFNNHGRRSECMAYNWLRGFAVLMFFMPTISKIFGVRIEDITFAGKDHELDATTFKKSPLADISIKSGLKVEIQAGFQNKNDLKKHKITEALKQFKASSSRTILIHFDLFNGKAAVIDITILGRKKLKYQARAAMEGKEVFELPPHFFNWDLTKAIPGKVLTLGKNAAK